MWDIWYFSCFSFKIQTNFQSNLFFRCCWTYIVTITWISMMEVAVKVMMCLQDFRNVHFTDFFLGKFWRKSVRFNFRFILHIFDFQNKMKLRFVIVFVYTSKSARWFPPSPDGKRARFYKNTETLCSHFWLRFHSFCFGVIFALHNFHDFLYDLA